MKSFILFLSGCSSVGLWPGNCYKLPNKEIVFIEKIEFTQADSSVTYKIGNKTLQQSIDYFDGYKEVPCK